VADERRAEAEHLAAEAARQEEKQRKAEAQRKAALRKPDVDNHAAMNDWLLFT